MLKKIGKNRIIDCTIAIAVAIIAASAFVFTAKLPYGNEHVLVFVNALLLLSGLAIILSDRIAKKALWRSSVILFVLCALFLAVYIPFEKYRWMDYLRDLDNLRAIILSTGSWGIVIFFIITFSSVIFLPLPAAIIIVAGTLIYGAWISFIVSSFATFTGSLVCFALGRKLGKKLLYWMFDRKKVDKYADLLARKGKIPFIMMMLLPFFPDDLICVTAGITDMSFKFFAISVAISRSAYIAVISFVGGITFTWTSAIIVAAIFLACLVLSWIVNKKLFEKNKKKASARNTCSGGDERG